MFQSILTLERDLWSSTLVPKLQELSIDVSPSLTQNGSPSDEVFDTVWKDFEAAMYDKHKQASDSRNTQHAAASYSSCSRCLKWETQ